MMRDAVGGGSRPSSGMLTYGIMRDFLGVM
jgi:hypothetical protein